MSALKRLGLDENTIVVLSSDNGAVVDDGYQDQAAELLGDHKPNGVLRGGKYSLYEGGTRVPCILRWKGRVRPGISDNLTFQLDWMASFAEMCGVKLPEGCAPDSENHLESWLNADKPGRKYIVVQNMDNNLSITDGRWKYIPAADGPETEFYTGTEMGTKVGRNQQYDLNSDPGERNNLYESRPGKARKLHLQLMYMIEN